MSPCFQFPPNQCFLLYSLLIFHQKRHRQFATHLAGYQDELVLLVDEVRVVMCLHSKTVLSLLHDLVMRILYYILEI